MSHTSVPGPVNFKMFLRILKRMLKKAEGTKKESVSFNSISCLPFSKFNASLSDTVADTLSIPLQHIHANAGSQGSLGCFQELLETNSWDFPNVGILQIRRKSVNCLAILVHPSSQLKSSGRMPANCSA